MTIYQIAIYTSNHTYLFMPGSKKEIREITEALRDGRVTTEQLRINASRVIRSTQRLTKERKSK